MECGALSEPLDRVDRVSMDTQAEDVRMLASLFPEAVVDGRPDLEGLRRVLGVADEAVERYQFGWHGKNAARRIAHAASTGTLRPIPEESADWDQTRNVYIEGDNLEVLKLLQKSYYGRVKMVYIDPPYNTGGEFIYPDNYQDNLQTYLRYTGQVDADGFRLSANAETSGRYHTNWLNMMYPRLRLARNLLREDGVLFVSIGDAELPRLWMLCEEIFGEENCLGCVTRVAKKTSNKGTYFAPSKDYVLAFARSAENVAPLMDAVDSSYAARFSETDERGHFATVGLYQAALDPRPNQRYWVECPDGTYAIPPGNVFPDVVEDASWVRPQSSKDRVWRWSYGSYLEKKHLLVFKRTIRSPLLTPEGTQSPWNVYTKYYLEDRLSDGTRPRDFLSDITNDLGTAALKALGLDDCFDFAKPPQLLDRLIQWLDDRDGIYVDFFAGSGTMAQAIMERNASDGGRRRFLLVQLPEPTPEGSVAAEEGFTTISQVCMERIRRVGAEIDKQLSSPAVDTGFRAFRLSSSNLLPWDAAPADLMTSLLGSVDSVKPGRSDGDVITEVLLRSGLDLSMKTTKVEIAGQQVYVVGSGALILAVGPELCEAVAQGIVTLKAQLQPDVIRVVLKESSFADDVAKTNVMQILKQAGIDDVKSI